LNGTRTYGGRRSSAGGFTLLEIMVVLAVIALIMGSAVHGFRSLAKSDLRNSSAKMSGAVRFLFDRASTTGKNHRLVIDLDTGRYWAEVSDDRFYIPHEAETQAQAARREAEEAEKDEDEQKRRDELSSSDSTLPGNSSFDMSKLDVGEFRPKRARFAAFKETALKPVAVKNSKIRSVYTPRLTDPVTSGRAYVYFFPLGQTEPAIITLSDPDGESIYSLVVHPITGRVRIYNYDVRPPVGETDDQGNQVVQ
jgi:general secretion pathway protein H